MVDKFSQVASNIPAANADTNTQYLVINGYPVVFSFSKETLAEMITAQEEKLRELDALYESSYAETEKTAELMDNVSKLYEELISFSDLYDSASFEAKKMIVNQLIRRVDVYRGYQLNITFNFDLTPYIEGDDAAAC